MHKRILQRTYEDIRNIIFKDKYVSGILRMLHFLKRRVQYSVLIPGLSIWFVQWIVLNFQFTITVMYVALTAIVGLKYCCVKHYPINQSITCRQAGYIGKLCNTWKIFLFIYYNWTGKIKHNNRLFYSERSERREATWAQQALTINA